MQLRKPIVTYRWPDRWRPSDLRGIRLLVDQLNAIGNDQIPPEECHSPGCCLLFEQPSFTVAFVVLVWRDELS